MSNRTKTNRVAPRPTGAQRRDPFTLLVTAALPRVMTNGQIR